MRKTKRGGFSLPGYTCTKNPPNPPKPPNPENSEKVNSEESLWNKMINKFKPASQTPTVAPQTPA